MAQVGDHIMFTKFAGKVTASCAAFVAFTADTTNGKQYRFSSVTPIR